MFGKLKERVKGMFPIISSFPFILGINGKKGDWGMDEIGKILIAVVIFAVIAFGGVYLIYSGKGKEVLDSIKSAIRFGRT